MTTEMISKSDMISPPLLLLCIRGEKPSAIFFLPAGEPCGSEGIIAWAQRDCQISLSEIDSPRLSNDPPSHDGGSSVYMGMSIATAWRTIFGTAQASAILSWVSGSASPVAFRP